MKLRCKKTGNVYEIKDETLHPLTINSSLVSAQNRNRLYWTNIASEPEGFFGDLVCSIPQPKDKGILLKDILETDVADKYFLSGKMLDYLNSRKANYNNGKINYKTENDAASCLNASTGLDISDNIIIDTNRKAQCFTAGGNSGGLHSQMDLIKCVAMRGREAVLTPKRTEYGKAIRKDYESGNIKEQRKNVQSLEPRTDGKTNCLTSVQKDNLLQTESNIRRLTPMECERLQCVPDGYSDFVSDSQRYKMLGNGWTISVISHIFSYLKQ